jgi:hypothetical protein
MAAEEACLLTIFTGYQLHIGILSYEKAAIHFYPFCSLF